MMLNEFDYDHLFFNCSIKMLTFINFHSNLYDHIAFDNSAKSQFLRSKDLSFFSFLSLAFNRCNIETMNWGLSILIGFVFLIMLVLQTRANIHIIQLKQAAKCNHTSHIQSYKRKK